MALYLTLFFVFFKIGLFTIGGGYAMLPLIQDEVIAHQWMSLDEFTEFVGIAESTPGPFAVNTATFCGMHAAGIPGAAVATVGVVLPSLLCILLIARFFARFADAPYVKAAMRGVKPVVVALIAVAVLRLVLHSLQGPHLTEAFLIAGLFAFAQFRKTHPIALIGIAAICGILIYGVAGFSP